MSEVKTSIGIPTDERPTLDLNDFQSDGNALALMGKVIRVLKRSKFKDRVDEYTTAAMAGDYDNLIQVSMQYVKLEDLSGGELEEDYDCEADFFEEHEEECSGECPDCEFYI